jgi:hypothetical protein
MEPFVCYSEGKTYCPHSCPEAGLVNLIQIEPLVFPSFTTGLRKFSSHALGGEVVMKKRLIGAVLAVTMVAQSTPSFAAQPTVYGLCQVLPQWGSSWLPCFPKPMPGKTS